MYFHDAKNLDEALKLVRREEFRSVRQVAAAVGSLRPFVAQRLGDGQLFTNILVQIVDEVSANGALLQPNSGEIVARIIRDHVCPAPARVASRHSATHTCAECESASDWPVAPRVSGAGAYVPFMQPVSERRVTVRLDDGLRTPYRFAQGLFSCDHYHPALNRAAVRRMVRSLGPDLGPEPPSGGSLARV